MNFYRADDVPQRIRPFVAPEIVRHPIQLAFPEAGVDLEIGAGCGEHAFAHAGRDDVEKLIAIEKTRSRFGKFQTRFLSEGKPPKLVPIHANAVDWVSSFLPQGVVRRCFILYPNPYPKRKQQNLRWAQMPFMGRLLESLQENGQIEFRSNVPEYIDETVLYMTKCWGLVLISREQITENPETLFEKKYLERGENCQRVCLQKTN